MHYREQQNIWNMSRSQGGGLDAAASLPIQLLVSDLGALEIGRARAVVDRQPTRALEHAVGDGDVKKTAVRFGAQLAAAGRAIPIRCD